MPVPRHEAKAELFRTLGHPVRIRVLELLCEREHAERVAGETIAQRAKAAREAHRVRLRGSGRASTSSIAAATASTSMASMQRACAHSELVRPHRRTHAISRRNSTCWSRQGNGSTVTARHGIAA